MKKKANGGYFWAIILSLLLHGILIVGMLWGTDFDSLKTPTPPKAAGQSIQATVIDPALVSAQAKKIRDQQALAKQQEADRLRKLEQKAQQIERQREQEEQRLRDLQKQKLLAEKRAREAEKKAKEAEEKKLLLAKQQEKAREEKLKAEEAVRLAQEQAQLAKLEQEKQLEAQRQAQAATREAEEKRKAAELDAAKAQQQKAEREAALNELFSELESETEQLSSARAKYVADEVSQWSSRYVVMIQQKWLIDSSMQSKGCRLNLRLAPDGLVLSVTALSGDPVLCRSAKASVVSINKFPMPSGSEVVEKLRNINLNFQL